MTDNKLEKIMVVAAIVVVALYIGVIILSP